MSYKEFLRWCNKRAHDGCWGMLEALTCCYVNDEIKNLPFWKRERRWCEIEHEVVTEIIEPTNAKIRELMDKEG